MKLVIPMNPKTKGRPRFSFFTKRVHTPESTIQFENNFRAALLIEFGLPLNRYPLYEKTVPLHVHIDFVIQRKSSYVQRSVLKGLPDPKDRAWRPYGGDLDNYAKAVLDAANELIWHDDRQITSLLVRKFIAARKEESSIELSVSPLLPYSSLSEEEVQQALDS